MGVGGGLVAGGEGGGGGGILGRRSRRGGRGGKVWRMADKLDEVELTEYAIIESVMGRFIDRFKRRHPLSLGY